MAGPGTDGAEIEARPGFSAGGSSDAGPVGRVAGRWRRSPAQWGRRANLMAALGLALAVGAASSAVALLGQGPPATSSGSGAAPAIRAVPAADGIGNLRMVSTSDGWAQRLTDGAILHTTQGVWRWTVASPPAGRIVAVAYVGSEVARALTVPGGAAGRTTVQAWATQDGGTAWSPEVTLDVQGFNASIEGALDFLDAENGWFSQIEAAAGVAGTALYRTVDGGAHWTEVAATGGAAPGQPGAIPDGCDALTAAFISASTGWITGTCLAAAPPFYRTQDGGTTWAPERLAGLPAGSGGETSFPPTFTSGERGTLLTVSESETAISTSLFATSDGGASWQLRSTTAGTPIADAFLGADDGWLATDGEGEGSAPDLYATHDGGSTWTRLNAFPYAGLRLDFLTPTVGWAAADLGEVGTGPTYLVQTADGGRDWTAVLPHLVGASPSP
jgi:photosystem II stability/assembly factor-like uncharacterized protein